MWSFLDRMTRWQLGEYSDASDDEVSVDSPLESSVHYPSTPEDIYRARRWLQHACPHHLPDELLKPILFHANYDCLYFSASTSARVERISDGAETPAEAYVETEPLKFLKKLQASGQNTNRSYGRIRSIRLQATGKDQGWVSDRASASWSWFELGKRQPDITTVSRGPKWAWNAVAGREWQAHELVYNADDADVNAELDAWVKQLEGGDCISIVPMAQFGGWTCQVRKAYIEIEVQMWR